MYAIVFCDLSSVDGIANRTEHPDLISRHAWLAASSIWIMEQVRRLQALPNAHAHHLQHCKFGGAIRKPMRFMTVNMEKEVTEEPRKVERPRTPTGCLLGKYADGSWKASQAKEYPRAMSAGIAVAMVRAACKHQSILTQADAEEVIEQVASFLSSFYTPQYG